MLWNPNASALRPLPWNLLGIVSLLLRIAGALPGSSEKDCTLKVTLRDFRLILSWEFQSHRFTPTHYTLWYTIMSKNEEMKMVGDCEHITRSFCDLTHVWRDVGETYIPQVVGLGGNGTLVSCMRDILLTTNMSLEPPKFEIVGSTHHIKVTTNIPAGISGLIEELLFNAPLVIEERSEMIVKKHKPKISGNMAGEFSYIIDKLIPNTNYCISVYFEHSHTDVAPTIKCIFLRPEEESETSESGKIGGIIFIFLMVAAILSALNIMKRTGYICLRHDFPQVLNFHNISTCVFVELSPWEKMDLVEVILVSKKKKVWHNNNDDRDDNNDHNNESDSEDEAAPGVSPGYTMHGLVGQLLSPASSSRTLDSPEDLTSEGADPEEPEADTEPLEVARPDPLWRVSGACEGTGDLPPGAFAEESDGSTEGSGGRNLFNVDLKSVCVRSLEDEESSSSLLLPLPEGTMDPEDPEETDSGLMEASIAMTWLPLAEGLWPESAPSEESDSSSESNLCFGDGYIAR